MPRLADIDSTANAAGFLAGLAHDDVAKTVMAPVLCLAQNHVAGSALTGSTALTTLATITIPGGLLGLNGTVRVTAKATGTGVAGTKSLGIQLNGTTLGDSSYGAAQTDITAILSFGNRNSQALQMGSGAGISGGVGSSNGATTRTGAVNTAPDTTLTIFGQLANAADSMTLQSYVVEVIPGT